MNYIKLKGEGKRVYCKRDATAATVVLRHKEGLSAHKTCVKPDCFGANRDNPKCPDCGFLTECWNEVIKKYWCRGSADATARMRALYFRA